MYIEQLHYIVEVYRTGYISKAAENCYVTIPTISQSIIKLENELGIKIFKRSNQGSVPTRTGKNVIKKALEIIIKIEELKRETKSNNNLINGELNLSASPSQIFMLLKAAQEFKKRYPHVKVNIIENTATEAINSLENNKVECCFVFLNDNILNNKEKWKFELLFRVNRYICVNKNSPLALQDSVAPEDILNYPLIVYNGVNLKSFLKDFFNKYGEMTILFESNQIEIIKKSIVEGFGISFLSELLIRNDPRIINGEIVPIVLNNHNSTPLPFGWVSLKNIPLSYTMKVFLDHVREQINIGNY